MLYPGVYTEGGGGGVIMEGVIMEGVIWGFYGICLCVSHILFLTLKGNICTGKIRALYKTYFRCNLNFGKFGAAGRHLIYSYA